MSELALNPQKVLLDVDSRHAPRVVFRAAIVREGRGKSLNRWKDDGARRRSHSQLPWRATKGVAPIALVVGIKAEAERAVGVILGIARRVKNAEASPDDPLVRRGPGNAHSRPTSLVIAILDGRQVADLPSISLVALPAKQNAAGVCATILGGIRDHWVVIPEQVVAYSPATLHLPAQTQI